MDIFVHYFISKHFDMISNFFSRYYGLFVATSLRLIRACKKEPTDDEKAYYPVFIFHNPSMSLQ